MADGARGLPDVPGVPRPGVGSAVAPAVAVGQRHHPHVGPGAQPAGTAELVRTDIDQRRRVAMVRALEDDHVGAPGSCSRQAQRQVVGLRAGVDQVADRQRFGERRREPVGVAHQELVQVAGIGVEHGALPMQRVDDGRVGVPHVADVVHGVEEGAAGVVEQVLPRPADDGERLLVGEAQRGSDAPPPACQELLRRRRRVRRRGGGWSPRRLQRLPRRQGRERDEAFQRRPGRVLRDREVRVVRSVPPLVRGDGHAHAEPHHHEVEQYAALRCREPANGTVPRDDRLDGGEGVGRVQAGVGGGHRQIADGIGLHQVAEVEDAGHGSSVLFACDEEIVVVGVVVHDASVEVARRRQRVPQELQQRALDHPASVRTIDCGQAVPDDRGCVGEVPVQPSLRARVGEPLEGLGESRHERAHALEQLGRPVADRPQHGTRDPGEQSYEQRRAVRVAHRHHVVTVQRRNHARAAESRIARGQMCHRRVLRLERLATLQAVGDLQDEARAVRGRDEEVLVPLALERGRLRGEAPSRVRDSGRLVEAQVRGRLDQGGRAALTVHGANVGGRAECGQGSPGGTAAGRAGQRSAESSNSAYHQAPPIRCQYAVAPSIRRPAGAAAATARRSASPSAAIALSVNAPCAVDSA